jgi:hypothetical protein
MIISAEIFFLQILLASVEQAGKTLESAKKPMVFRISAEYWTESYSRVAARHIDGMWLASHVTFEAVSQACFRCSN